jgi:hypothetical protein
MAARGGSRRRNEGRGRVGCRDERGRSPI